MGWMYVHKEDGVSVKDFFVNEFSWKKDDAEVKVLDVAVVGLRTAYLAVERNFIKDGQPRRDVLAMVCLLDYRKNDYHNFGYKDMDEGSHPYYYDCPKRILDQLTPTDNENANEWRRICRERLEQTASKPKLKTGMWLWLAQPVTFSSGDELQAFYIQDAKKRNFRKHEHGYVNYQLPKRILDRGFEVLTEDEVKQRMLEKCKVN